jgi:hypothetical protein
VTSTIASRFEPVVGDANVRTEPSLRSEFGVDEVVPCVARPENAEQAAEIAKSRWKKSLL